VNVTFYIWPIGCTLFVQNITAKVRGDNTLLWKEDTLTPTATRTPFIRPHAPDDPWELTWAPLFSYVSPQSSPYLLFSGLNSTSNSLSLLEKRLSTMTSLSYALLAQQWRRTVSLEGDSQFNQSWSPIFANVSGSRSIVMAGLVVHSLPLAIGIVTCFALVFVFVTTARQTKPTDNIIRDGRVINMISLLHNSTLPAVVADGNEDDRDLRRIRAVNTHVM
jgi:hypothetical protein